MTFDPATSGCSVCFFFACGQRSHNYYDACGGEPGDEASAGVFGGLVQIHTEISNRVHTYSTQAEVKHVMCSHGYPRMNEGSTGHTL